MKALFTFGLVATLLGLIYLLGGNMMAAIFFYGYATACFWLVVLVTLFRRFN